MKRIIKEHSLDQISASAWLDPSYSGNRYIKSIYVVQGGEGPIPHMHVDMKSGERSYIRLDVPEYSSHHSDCYKLNSKEKQELQGFLERVSSFYIKSFISDEVRNVSNYSQAVSLWVESYGNLDLFKLDSDGFPIQPNYLRL